MIDRRDQLRPERVGDDRRRQPGEQRRQVVGGRADIDLLERVHHALADAARRHVDHAAQGDVVVRVENQLEVRERVLDLLALVKPDAAQDDVADVGLAQSVFDRPRLRVGAVEHGHRVLDVLGQRLPGNLGDVVGFFELVSAAEVDDLRATLAIGPQRLLLAVAVVADDRRGRVENHLRRAIVAFEAHDDRLREVGFEVEDVAKVGAAPFVDRLVRIADDGEIAVSAGDLLDQQVLGPVRVLVFVDHDELELPRVALAHGRRAVEELDGFQEQIVEVERARFLQRAQVARVQPSDLAILGVPALLEYLRTLHAVFRMADPAQHHPRLQRRIVEAVFLD